jgi:hypothetical protein
MINGQQGRYCSPLASKMFSDDGNETFQTSQYRTMNDDRARGRLVGAGICVSRAVLEVESLWELEVQLDRRALE